jgi:single-strand DNA-binding protein
MNVILLIGNVGKDPEIRNLQSGSSVASFSVATSEHWKDKGGERQEKTTWHNCIVWGGLVTVVENYVTKGSKIAIEGRLESRKWTDRDGNERTAMEVNVQRLELLSPKKERSEDDDDGAPRVRRSKPKPKPKDTSNEGYDLDDEVPF